MGSVYVCMCAGGAWLGRWGQLRGYNLQHLHQKSKLSTICKRKCMLWMSSPKSNKHAQVICMFSSLKDHYFIT